MKKRFGAGRSGGDAIDAIEMTYSFAYDFARNAIFRDRWCGSAAEHRLGKAEVMSSILITSSIFKNPRELGQTTHSRVFCCECASAPDPKCATRRRRRCRICAKKMPRLDPSQDFPQGAQKRDRWGNADRDIGAMRIPPRAQTVFGSKFLSLLWLNAGFSEFDAKFRISMQRFVGRSGEIFGLDSNGNRGSDHFRRASRKRRRARKKNELRQNAKKNGKKREARHFAAEPE